MAPRLGVNVDHVATLRQARRTSYPDPVQAAVLAELAGADQITVHLREDRRHVQERDVEVLRRTVQTRLNLEMAATPEMLAFARRLRPDMCTLVPERRQELTTEGGLDVVGGRDAVRGVVEGLRDDGIVASLFVDPDPRQLEAASDVAAHVVEIHTGRYCDAAPGPARNAELARIVDAVRVAAGLRLGVAAGHGLDYRNVTRVAAIPGMEELNIGHSIVGRAVLVGLERAVREMKDLLERAGRAPGA